MIKLIHSKKILSIRFVITIALDDVNWCRYFKSSQNVSHVKSDIASVFASKFYVTYHKVHHHKEKKCHHFCQCQENISFYTLNIELQTLSRLLIIKPENTLLPNGKISISSFATCVQFYGTEFMVRVTLSKHGIFLYDVNESLFKIEY